MKILYIAPFRDFSGYAYAARGYLRALHSAGLDIVARAIRYDKADLGKEYQPTQLEKELLQKPLENIDVIISHCTPNEMRLPDIVKDKVNIAVVALETNRAPDYWVEKLNQFDGVITFCQTSVDAFKDSGVTVPVYIVPHCFDIESYDAKDTEPLKPIGAEQFINDRFIFYNISQFSHKKGLDVLLQAYYAQFWDKADDVALVLKTYVNMGGNRKGEQEYLSQWIGQIRSAMRLPKYPPVILITDNLTDHEVKRLHVTGDCYVASSRGEGWNIPAFEGLASGNKLVTTSWGGMSEFAKYLKDDGLTTSCDNVFLVDYSLEPLVGMQHSDPDLFTARDMVAEPSVSSMMQAMQEAMDTPLVLPTADLEKFDHSVIGPQMLKVIEEVSMKETSNV